MICRELKVNQLLLKGEREAIKMRILQEPGSVKLAVDSYLKTGEITSFRDRIRGELGLPRRVKSPSYSCQNSDTTAPKFSSRSSPQNSSFFLMKTSPFKNVERCDSQQLLRVDTSKADLPTLNQKIVLEQVISGTFTLQYPY